MKSNLRRQFIFTLVFLLLAANCPAAVSPGRTVVDFDFDWSFSRGDFPTATMAAFDDSAWRRVNVPHDWSIEGPFSAEFGSGNGFAPGGIGWYRKHFKLDDAQRGKSAEIEFDGVYDYSEVWINGAYVGGRPYGFSSFHCDLTPYLKFGSADNVVAVRVDHSRFADSRFYTGSGIYRHVRLCVTDKLHLAHDGIYVTTPKIENGGAVVRIETTMENHSGSEENFALESEIFSPDGKSAGTLTTSTNADTGATQTVVQEINLPAAQLWTLESPTLYTLKTRVKSGEIVADETATEFGIRTAVFDADKGFLLNGQAIKLKGVCIHHDAGCLGAAVPDKVLERRLRLLKELGANAIRTSHNPPAPELLAMCDHLGLLVKDEAFDEFTPSKNKWVTGRNDGLPSRFGYAEMFDQWAVTDLQDMVRRDRNHPCVILWSIGNEIDFANDPFTDPVLGGEYRPGNPPAQQLVKCATPLIAAVKTLDRSRPVTAALATMNMSEAVGLPELLDAVGYNYQEARYAEDHRKFPKRIIFGSETSQAYAAWTAVRDNEYVAGQFLWTGIDYLGEANQWPNRASGPGLLDLCGFKKPLAWFRQSLWSAQPMVYICAQNQNRGSGFGGGRRGGAAAESWNWPSNSTITVQCYANCPEVTLALNDKIIGTKNISEAVNGVLTWRTPYEPGVLKAVGRSQGKDVATYELKTAGAAARIELIPDVTILRADGKDICHLEFRIVDAQGVRVPDANPEVTFEINGPAKLLGLENGDVNSAEPYQGPTRAALRGRGLAILESTRTAGEVTVKVSAPGIPPARLTLQTTAANLP